MVKKRFPNSFVSNESEAISYDWGLRQLLDLNTWAGILDRPGEVSGSSCSVCTAGVSKPLTRSANLLIQSRGPKFLPNRLGPKSRRGPHRRILLQTLSSRSFVGR